MEFLKLETGYTTQTFTIEKKVEVASRWSGEVEESRKVFVGKLSDWFITAVLANHVMGAPKVYAESTTDANVDRIRAGFETLLDVFTALAEPILWFYALTACILIATKNKETGFNRLKHVAYAYAGIALLPAFFSLLRWIAEMIKGAIQFS